MTTVYSYSRLRSVFVVGYLVLVAVASGCQLVQKGAGSNLGDVGSTKSKKVALVVGINDYKFVNPRLPFAEVDANVVGDTLRDRYGYSVERLLGEAATTSTVKRRLLALLTNATPGDESLFFFSGHGQGVGESQAMAGYLITQDCNPADPANCFWFGELADWARSTKTHKFLAVLDACYTGAFGMEAMGNTDLPDAPLCCRDARDSA